MGSLLLWSCPPVSHVSLHHSLTWVRAKPRESWGPGQGHTAGSWGPAGPFQRSHPLDEQRPHVCCSVTTEHTVCLSTGLDRVSPGHKIHFLYVRGRIDCLAEIQQIVAVTETSTAMALVSVWHTLTHTQSHTALHTHIHTLIHTHTLPVLPAQAYSH